MKEEWSLPTRHVGRRVLVYDRIDSTSTRAQQLADDRANDGVAVLAAEQTAGRGQYGRTWVAPPGSSVQLSALVFPPPNVLRPAVLTAWAAVSAAELIQIITGLQAKIKWPNDVFLRGRKVCGILIEQGQGVVAGIGLNLNQTAEDFAAAGLPVAGSLALFTGRRYDFTEIARELLSQLDDEYGRLMDGDRATLEACWKWRVGLLGKQVRVEGNSAEIRGRLVEQSFDGLEIQTVAGSVKILPELVRHLYGADE
jgi:BirA family biotin operon repressor/biotin-[acetyl-CoA-carboxylase] ligase